MVRVKDSHKSQTVRSPVDMSDPEVDIERGRRGLKEMENSSPKFKDYMDKLRKAAKAVAGKGSDFR